MSGSVTHLAGAVVQCVAVNGAILPVLDLEEAGTLGGASVLGHLGGRSSALRQRLQGGRGRGWNIRQLTERHLRAEPESEALPGINKRNETMLGEQISVQNAGRSR